MKLAVALTAAVLLGLLPSARANTPLGQVKSTTERVLQLLKEPSLQGDTKKEERRKVVRAEMEARFAWEDSARACLGRHWPKRTSAEKEEFIQIFSQFLKDTYSDKIATFYGDLDKIDYQGEKIVDGNYASVKVILTTKAKVDHPVEYRMEKTAAGDDWKVYDVVIEGVSLVKNYRDQFEAIIAKSSYDGLIKEIKSRQVEVR